MKLTIGNKLGIGFAFFTALIVILGSFSLLTGYRINARFSVIEKDWLPSAVLLGKMNGETADFRVWQAIYNLETDPGKLAKFEEKMQEQVQEFQAYEGKYIPLVSSDKEKKLYENFDRKWKKYLHIHKTRFLPKSQAHANVEASAVLHDTTELFEDLSSDLHELIQLNEEGGVAESRAADREYGHMMWLSLLLISLAVLMAIVIAIKLTLSITRPLNSLVKSTEVIASGDLTQEVNAQSEDEIGDLANSFRQMLESLRNTVGQLLSTSAQVSSSSEELSAASEQMNSTTQEVSSTVQQIAKGAQTTAQRVEETSKVMEQMNASVSQVAAGAQQAASASLQAKHAAEKGSEAAEETMKKMNSIFGVIANSSQVVKKLGERSEDITQIVSVITDIADQTNLLALNAAIEAARAGEAGRGFAVVADEVRKLAEGSAKAADQISRLIKEIQKETGQAVTAMEAGSKEVSEGRQIVTENSRAFKEIVKVVEQTATMVEQISAATEQMAAGTKQVVKSVDEIAANAEEAASATEEAAASTEEMTASMEEMTASAQELAEMAIRLRELGKRFKVKENFEKMSEMPGHEEIPAVLSERRKPLASEYHRPKGPNGSRKKQLEPPKTHLFSGKEKK